MIAGWSVCILTVTYTVVDLIVYIDTRSPLTYRLWLTADQGRGMDRLPRDETAPLEAALVRALDAAELRRAFRAATDGLLAEIQHLDPELAERLKPPFLELNDPGASG